jgi:hypothetical protein
MEIKRAGVRDRERVGSVPTPTPTPARNRNLSPRRRARARVGARLRRRRSGSIHLLVSWVGFACLADSAPALMFLRSEEPGNFSPDFSPPVRNPHAVPTESGLTAMPFGNSQGTNGPTRFGRGRWVATQGRLVDPSGPETGGPAGPGSLSTGKRRSRYGLRPPTAAFCPGRVAKAQRAKRQGTAAVQEAPPLRTRPVVPPGHGVRLSCAAFLHCPARGRSRRVALAEREKQGASARLWKCDGSTPPSNSALRGNHSFPLENRA